MLKYAKDEGHNILDDVQYAHIVEIEKRLVDFGDNEELADLDIKRIEGFWELREKGGPLRRTNLRIYFATISESGMLVVLKTYKKEEDGAVSRHIVLNVEDRLERFRAGQLREGASEHHKKIRPTA